MTAVLSTDVAELRAILDSLGWPQPDSAGNPPGSGASGSQASSPHADPNAAAAEPPVDRSPQRPEAALATMLGLTGTVALGDQLDRTPPLHAADFSEAGAALHRQLLLTMVKRHGSIAQRIERRYDQAFIGLRPVPNAAAMLEVLISHQIFQHRSPEAAKLAAQKLSGRYRFLFASTLGVVRKEIFWLRDDVTRILGQSCPGAEDLLSLDRALVSALEQATARTQHNLEQGVGKRFAELLFDAIMVLPSEPAPDLLDSWFQRRGFVERFLHDCRQLTEAILRSEWSQLRGLVEACCGPLGHSSRLDQSDDPMMTKEEP